MNIEEIDKKCDEFMENLFFRGWKGNSEWIIDACAALVELKEQEPDVFEAFTLHFHEKMIERFLKIGRDDRLSDPDLVEKLPDSYSSIEKLASLPDTLFFELREFDLIGKDLKRVQIEALKKGEGDLVTIIEKRKKTQKTPKPATSTNSAKRKKADASVKTTDICRDDIEQWLTQLK